MEIIFFYCHPPPPTSTMSENLAASETEEHKSFKILNMPVVIVTTSSNGKLKYEIGN